MYKWSEIPPTMFDFFIYLLIFFPFLMTLFSVARHNEQPEQAFILLWMCEVQQ